MMRKSHYLLSCYATASSIATTRSCVDGFSIPCQSSGRIASLTSFRRSRNAHHRQGDISSTNQILARHLGSKSMNFQQQFLKPRAKKSGDDHDEDSTSDLKDEGENEEEEEEPDAYNYQPSNDVIKSQSMDWIKKVVIGYNLCPFADRPLRENKLKVSVVRGNDGQHIAGAVVYELISRSDESQAGTTIVIAPECHPDDFEQYMSLVQLIEDDVMEEHDLHGLVQLASFHPKYEFAGSGSDGIDNYTNRSPYPMFHILREDEVEGAVDKLGGDASKVWNRNVKLLETMQEQWGREAAERAMRGEAVEGMDALLKEVKISGYGDNDSDIPPGK